MKNKTFLTAVILSACISLFICPEVSGRINKASGYGAFAACDTWQKWAEHITGGVFEFTGFARHDNERSEELAAYVCDRFMTNADDDELATEAHDDVYTSGADDEYATYEYDDEYMEYAYDDEYASDTTDDYTVPGYDEWYDEEGWADLSYYSDMGGEESYQDEYNAEHYYSRAWYDDDDEYFDAGEYASFYDDEQHDMDGYYEAGEEADCEYDEDYKAYKEEDEEGCEGYDDEYEDFPSEYEEDDCSD